MSELTIIDLTEEEQEDHDFILSLTRGAPYKLNLGDPQQYRYALNMLKRTGDTPENSPHTFATATRFVLPCEALSVQTSRPCRWI